MDFQDFSNKSIVWWSSKHLAYKTSNIFDQNYISLKVFLKNVHDAKNDFWSDDDMSN